MQKFLLCSSALVVSGLLSGVAEAACIQTPTCSSLGYTSSSACTGGVKCPFGNAWNCTGPNNTTKINSINTSITNILNRITKLENNSGSGSGSGSGTGGYSQACSNCNVGQVYNSGYCFDVSNIANGVNGYYYVYAKESGKCKAFSLYENVSTTLGDITLKQIELSQKVDVACRTDSALRNSFRGLELAVYRGVINRTFRDGAGSYNTYSQYFGCNDNGYLFNFSGTYTTKADFDSHYIHIRANLPKGISF